MLVRFVIFATDAVTVPLTATHPADASLPAVTVVSVKRNVTEAVTTKTVGA